ncbi:unnamed protein product, partial [Hapterophycus canaliculatus]
MDIKSIVDTANVIGKLTTHTTTEDTVNDLCMSVFQSSSYDRAMTYKFLDDLSGEVIYEIQHEQNTQSSLMGLRFPPGDIPLPARKAYVENPVRFVADVEKNSCELLQRNDDISLARSYLRGCALAHKRDLQNMGVKSSLSMAIIGVDGAPWGLVVMHSYSQVLIPKIEDRVLYTILTSVTSTHTQAIEQKARTGIENRMKNLVSQIDARESLGVFLLQNKKEMFETFRIDSVSLFTPEGPPTIVGEDAAKLDEIPIDSEPITVGTLDKPIRSFACLNILGYRLVFTRNSSCKPISWAGNPHELLEVTGSSSITVLPRQSFRKYMIHQSQTPPPFTKHDKILLSKTLDMLKSVIQQIKTEFAERKVVHALKQSDLVEMKSDQNYAFFANMSHELRTPLHALGGVFDILNNLYVENVRRYSKIGLDTCKDMMKTLDDILSIVRKTHE